MLVRSNNKEAAFQAIINTWLKDQTLYCNNCGQTFNPEKDSPECCDLPHIGRNMDHCMGIINQNKELSRTRGNMYASTRGKDLRWGVSMPVGLFYMLDNYKKSLGRPGLFKEKGELTWFLKKFKAFCIPEKV